MKQILCILALTYTVSFIHAQSSFIDRITVRQSFLSKADNVEPATFTYTNPKGKPESWLVNAAIGYNILNKPSDDVLTIEPYVEYHKNTLADKKQDNWQAGVSSQWQCNNVKVKKWSPVFISAIKYNDDNIKKNTSLQTNVYLTAFFIGLKKDLAYFWIPNHITDIGKIAQFSYSPYIGLETENRIKSETKTSSGSVYRAFLRINSTLTPFPASEKLREKFAFSFDWQYRYNISENIGNISQKDYTFFTAGFSYNFYISPDGKKAAKIGYDYVQGENPAKGFEKQSYSAVTLKVKF